MKGYFRGAVGVAIVFSIEVSFLVLIIFDFFRGYCWVCLWFWDKNFFFLYNMEVVVFVLYIRGKKDKV